ncbi:hypothetical protein [Sphingomonas corticis]|uniref:hypothetical protein n=1 Tax=Sphingomonas corticis TaxID=2722791 RepID=UPI001EEFBD9E|nr:hypothetical protein [Sphingomonas corticis]
MTAMVPDPDPRTAPDDDEDATQPPADNRGVSTQEPAEGSDDAPAGGPGSPDA